MLKLCDLQISKVQLENYRPLQGRVTVPSLYKSKLPEQGPWVLTSLHKSCFPGDIFLCQQTVNHPQAFAGLSFDAFLFIHLLLATVFVTR